jgi:hypothetical protein
MKPIPDFPGYFADEDGNIYSALGIGLNGKPPTVPRLLKPWKTQNGYLLVGLCKGGSRFRKKIARLVLETFVGSPSVGMEACHNNGIRTDDHLENLRWDTAKNNCADKIRHGTIKRGENNNTSKLTEFQVRVIRRCIEFGMKLKPVAETFKVVESTIERIAHRKTWKHV